MWYLWRLFKVSTRSLWPDGIKGTKASQISGKSKIDHPSITFSYIFQPFTFGESQQMLLIYDISKCPHWTCDSFSLSHPSHPPTHRTSIKWHVRLQNVEYLVVVTEVHFAFPLWSHNHLNVLHVCTQGSPCPTIAVSTVSEVWCRS